MLKIEQQIRKCHELSEAVLAVNPQSQFALVQQQLYGMQTAIKTEHLDQKLIRRLQASVSQIQFLASQIAVQEKVSTEQLLQQVNLISSGLQLQQKLFVIQRSEQSQMALSVMSALPETAAEPSLSQLQKQVEAQQAELARVSSYVREQKEAIGELTGLIVTLSKQLAHSKAENSSLKHSGAENESLKAQLAQQEERICRLEEMLQPAEVALEPAQQMTQASLLSGSEVGRLNSRSKKQGKYAPTLSE